ncbi:hypothetical protein D3C75_779090 [compost metagenome]
MGKSLRHLDMQINRILHIQLFRFLNQRTDQIGLPALVDLAADQLQHPLHQIRLNPVRRDRHTPFRPLRKRRHIHIAEDGNCQSTRNRCCCHCQHIRIIALAAQNASLVDTKAVLLVRYHHSQPAKKNILLNQGMSTDYNIEHSHLQ